jgi:hypothetical protein
MLGTPRPEEHHAVADPLISAFNRLRRPLASHRTSLQRHHRCYPHRKARKVGARPYRQAGVVELERLFRNDCDNLAILQALAEELTHRKTQRARALADRVRRRLEELSTQATAEPEAPDNTPVRLVPPAEAPGEEPDDESDLEPEAELELDSGEQGPKSSAAVPLEAQHKELCHRLLGRPASESVPSAPGAAGVRVGEVTSRSDGAAGPRQRRGARRPAAGGRSC